jgi:hypothetical protein
MEETPENEIMPGLPKPSPSEFVPIDRTQSNDLIETKSKILTVLGKIRDSVVELDGLQTHITYVMNIMQPCINVLMFSGYPENDIPAYQQLTTYPGPESVAIFWGKDVVEVLNMELSKLPPRIKQEPMSVDNDKGKTILNTWYELADIFKSQLRELQKKAVEKLEKNKKEAILRDIRFTMYELGKTIIEKEDFEDLSWRNLANLKDFESLESDNTNKHFVGEFLQEAFQYFWNGIESGTKGNALMEKKPWPKNKQEKEFFNTFNILKYDVSEKLQDVLKAYDEEYGIAVD